MKQRSRYPFYLAIFLLIAAGIALAVTRHVQLGIPWLAGEQKPVWMVEARIDFEASGEEVLVSLNVPDNPPGFRVLSQQAASPGYGFSLIEDSGDLRAEWSIRQAEGSQTLYFNVQLTPDGSTDGKIITVPPESEEVFWEEPQATAVTEVLERAAAKSASPESMTRELIKLMQSSEPDQNISLLLNNNPYVTLIQRMLNQAGIPARVADGLKLEDARRLQPLRPFLQIHNGERWLTIRKPDSRGCRTMSCYGARMRIHCWM